MLPKWLEAKFGQLNKIRNRKGQFIITSDTSDIYYDDSNGNRHILGKDIIIVNTIKALSNILAPLPDKLYFVKQTSKLYWFNYDTFSWNTNNMKKEYIPQLCEPVIATENTPLKFRKNNDIVYLYGDIDIKWVEDKVNNEFEICYIPEELMPNLNENEFYSIYLPKWTLNVYNNYISMINTNTDDSSIIKINGSYPIK